MAAGYKTGGRTKGTPNRLTSDVKAMILGALTKVGGEEYLVEQAAENPAAFLTLVGKVLPLQLSGDADNPIEVNVTQEERRRRAREEIDQAFPERVRDE
jgi:hypothetical protein